MSETRYQAIVDTAIDAIIVIDEHGIIQSFNPAAKAIFGYEPTEAVGRNIRMLMPEPDAAQHDGYLTNYRDSGVAKIIGIGREVVGRRKDGSLVPIDLSIARWTTDGRPYFTGIVRDLTERKHSEEQFRAAEAKYRAIVDTAVDAIVVIDKGGVIQSFNHAAERLFDYRTEEVVGKNVKVLMPEPYVSEHDRYLENYHRTGIPKIIGKGREVTGRRQDGSLFPLELSIAEWRSEQGQFFTGIMRDITDRKIAEEETRQAQTDLQHLNQVLEERVRAEVAEREAAQMKATHAERMQALGQLAGGVAHDFNNVLQAVFSAASRLETQPTAQDLIRAAHAITNAAERGASVTERLLAFARRSPLTAEPIDPASLLNDLSRLLGQTLGSGVTVRVGSETRMPFLLADRGQLETVLINLATNARDAMPNGGTLTFSAARTTIVHTVENSGDSLRQGRYIRITVSDTGTGMDEATLRRATEPFFTTKIQGEGTGLGLSMAKGFAEQSGGSLTIESELGQGTTIELLLPESDNGIEIGVACGDGTEFTKPHILLVDDDALVLDTLRTQLEAQGYAVSSAEGATEATAIFDHTGADLLLTDLAMPHVDGITLIEKLQARSPALPAILITGHSTERVSRTHAASFRLLHKPVRSDRLREEINASLEAVNHAPHVR